ncbi:unnamed protein product, partial [Sphacelaria rigidula]
MARMGFVDKAEELDRMIEAERTRLKKERDEQDAKVLDQKMAGLRVSHTRRGEAMDAAQIARIRALKEKCAAELEELKVKQKTEYDILISETATRATGGVSSCACTDAYKCRHNRSASYNTRKPTKDVIRLRQNGQRLRASGRLQEADEVDNMAAAIEARAEDHWRKRVEESILSSAWCGGKSRLEQTVERQQKTVEALLVTHQEKMALLKQQGILQTRNLQSTLAAERKKVILYCRREAIKRRTKDIIAAAKEARRMAKNKSNGMGNVSKNMFKDDDDSESELDSGDERLDGWKPPTASGVDNSKALSSYDDIASGNIYKKLEDGTFGADEESGGALKTSGSRAMDAYRLSKTGAAGMYDPTRGGAQVNMGKYAAKPPSGSSPPAAIAAKSNNAKDDSDDSDEDDSDDSDEADEEDEEDEEDEDDFGGGGGGRAKGSPPGGSPTVSPGPPRGPMPSAFPTGGFGGGPPGGLPTVSPGPPRGPMPSSFPAGGFGGGPPGGSPTVNPGPPRGPMPSAFPAGGFGGGPPGPPPGGSPTVSPGPPRGPMPSAFPAGGFGGGPPGGSPTVSPGPPRGPMPSAFPAGGFGGGPPGGPPGGSPTVSPGPPRGPMPSAFPAGGFGGGPPGGSPTAFPGPPQGPMPSAFPAGGFGGGPPGKPPAATSAPPRGPMPSAFPAGGFGSDPPGGSPTVSPGPPRGPMPNTFPAGGFGGAPAITP